MSSEASEKSIVQSRGQAGPPLRAQRAILLRHWPLSPRPHSARPHPSWHAKGLLRALFPLCFSFFYKEKWWEALLGYVCAPAAASASPAEPRAPAPLIFVHSLTRYHPRVAPSNLGVLHALPAGFSGLQRADSCSPGLTGRPVGAHHTSVMSWKQAQALKRREGRAVVQTVQRGLLKRRLRAQPEGPPEETRGKRSEAGEQHEPRP